MRLAARHSRFSDHSHPFGRLAQSAERLLYTQMVTGSSPVPPTALLHLWLCGIPNDCRSVTLFLAYLTCILLIDVCF
jgi:hypothetical protein